MKCQSTTKAGNPCKNNAIDGSNFCQAHKGKAKTTTPPVPKKPSQELPGWLFEGVEQHGVSRTAPDPKPAPAEAEYTSFPPAPQEASWWEVKIWWEIKTLPVWLQILTGAGTIMFLYLLIILIIKTPPAVLATGGLVGIIIWLKPWKRWKPKKMRTVLLAPKPKGLGKKGVLAIILICALVGAGVGIKALWRTKNLPMPARPTPVPTMPVPVLTPAPVELPAPADVATPAPSGPAELPPAP